MTGLASNSRDQGTWPDLVEGATRVATFGSRFSSCEVLTPKPHLQGNRHTHSSLEKSMVTPCPQRPTCSAALSKSYVSESVHISAHAHMSTSAPRTHHKRITRARQVHSAH